MSSVNNGKRVTVQFNERTLPGGLTQLPGRLLLSFRWEPGMVLNDESVLKIDGKKVDIIERLRSPAEGMAVLRVAFSVAA